MRSFAELAATLVDELKSTLDQWPMRFHHVSGKETVSVDEENYTDLAFEQQRKKKRVAYLLWLFFGWFGVHRLYAGKTGSGIAQLLLSLSVVGFVFVSFWWWLIDAFLVPDMVNEHNLQLLDLANHHGPLNHELAQEPRAVLTEADRRREEMLEDLRQTGYCKQPRDTFGNLYR